MKIWGCLLKSFLLVDAATGDLQLVVISRVIVRFTMMGQQQQQVKAWPHKKFEFRVNKAHFPPHE